MTPNALNYHHLLYFWAVAKEGSLRRASEVLHVSQPSISAQLKQLEESLGAPLFTRTTRRLILTDTGQTVLEYAEEIFSLGGELLTAVRQEPGERPLRLHVGVADSVPKIIVTPAPYPGLRFSAGSSAIPVELAAVEVGSIQRGREMISLDISEYGDPLDSTLTATPCPSLISPSNRCSVPT